jgi:hypothetical protein
MHDFLQVLLGLNNLVLCFFYVVFNEASKE